MAFSFSFFLPLCVVFKSNHCAAPNNVSNTNQMSRHVSHLMQRTVSVCACVCICVWVCVLKGMSPAKKSRHMYTLHIHTPDIILC